MPSCMIEGCESYKFATKQKIGYYSFPINNKPLLDKWLNQIKISDPKTSQQICSTHFHVNDIDFSEEYPKLKNNAVPMIFPLKHFQSIYKDELNPLTEHQGQIMGPRNLKKQAIACKKKMNLIDSKCTSNKAHNSPVVLLCTPSNKLASNAQMQIQATNDPSVHVKKIPIKRDNAKSSDFSTLNPYILIVSDNNETKIPFETTKQKHAVLRIQIEKKLNNASSHDSLINSVGDEHKSNQSDVNINQNCTKKDNVEEIEVNDVSSNKVVVFKFDSSTGEITVCKKEKLKNNTEASGEKSNAENFSKKSSCDNTKENEKNEQNHLQKPHQNQENVTSEEKIDSPCVTEKIQVKSLTEKPELSMTTEKVKSFIENSQVVAVSVDSQIPTNELPKAPEISIDKKDEETLNKNHNTDPCLQVVDSNIAQKRKSDVITINSSEDENEKSSDNIKKLKNDAKTTNP